MNPPEGQHSQADGVKTIPILPSAATDLHGPPSDVMDVSPSANASQNSSDLQVNGDMDHTMGATNKKGASNATGAAAAVQQPKVVQTAFIHKLYNMLEDQNIQHLISWSASNESFLISPSTEFSRVLSSYFKHTNVSSFVRQLNMYGFHKVNDVFHTGSPDSPYWEFKHGNGSFRRGDLNGLREIKRRASRHTLIHRDSYSTKPRSTNQPTPSAPEHPPESTEGRLNMLEHSLYDVHARLARAEESNSFMSVKCADLSDRLSQAYQYNHDICGYLIRLIEDADHPIHRDITSMQQDIGRFMETLRTPDGFQTPDRRPSFTQKFDPNYSLSPTSRPFDDRRRASIQTISRPNFSRPFVPSPQRHGSIGTGDTSPPARGPIAGATPLPNSNMASSSGVPYPPSTSSPLSMQPPPYIPRRHTSADIRTPYQQGEQHLQPPIPTNAPFANMSNPPSAPNSTPGSAPFPPTPMTSGSAGNNEQEQLRNSLANYSFGKSAQATSTNTTPSSGSNPASSIQASLFPAQPLPQQQQPLPAPPDRRASVATIQPVQHQTYQNMSPRATPAAGLPPSAPASSEPAWMLPPAVRQTFNKDIFGSNKSKGTSGTNSQNNSNPSTRRGSLANISTLLNPADTVEQSDEDEPPIPERKDSAVWSGEQMEGEEMRKRKRLV